MVYDFTERFTVARQKDYGMWLAVGDSSVEGGGFKHLLGKATPFSLDRYYSKEKG